MIGEPACINCKFFVDMQVGPGNEQELGECRRFPPNTEHILIGMRVFPDKHEEPRFQRIITPNCTSKVGWCGEHMRKLALTGGI